MWTAANSNAHHYCRRWTDGGNTDLDDLVLFGRRHHTLIHVLPHPHLAGLSVFAAEEP